MLLLHLLFMTQEKMRGRNKLHACLLGVTRENIMRVNANTKEVLSTWPLTTIRWWAASPTSFTLVSGETGEEGKDTCTNTSEKGIYSHSIHSSSSPPSSWSFPPLPFFLSSISSSPLSISLSLSLSLSQDRGDYSESFYSVQTTEGETISQLINNYIDIITHKKKPIHSEAEEHKVKFVMDFDIDPKKWATHLSIHW